MCSNLGNKAVFCCRTWIMLIILGSNEILANVEKELLTPKPMLLGKILKKPKLSESKFGYENVASNFCCE